MLIKSALRDLLFCVIGLEKHYVDQPPPVAFPPLVPHGTKGGISFARQGGWPVFPRPQGGCKGFIQTGAFYNLKAPTSPAQRYYITPEGGALNPPVRRQPITGRTLGAQGQRPGGAINPHARKGVSTFGNTGKHRPGPDPASATIAPKCCKRQSPHEPCLFLHSERTCRASDYNSLPTIGASCFSRPMRSSKVSGVMDSAPSHHACSGSL